MGPDYWLGNHRNGMVIEIGDEGINVFANASDAASGKEPIQSLIFSEPTDSQPSTLNPQRHR